MASHGAATEVSPEVLSFNNKAPLLNASIALLVLETLFTCLFYASRYTQKAYYGADVWFMTIGYLFNLGMLIVNFLLVSIGGAGKHIERVMLQSPWELNNFLKLEVAAQFLYNPAVTFPKLAICVLYLKIFTSKWSRRLTYATGLVMILTLISFEIASFTQCHPFAYYYDKTIPGGHCGNLTLQFQLAAIPNVVTDFALLFLPIPTVWKLHASKAQKIGLTLTFVMGSFGIVTAFIRLYYFFAIDLFVDPTYHASLIGTWIIVEPGVYLIACTLPFLRPLVRNLVQSSAINSSRVYLRSVFRRSTNDSDSSSLPTTTERNGQSYSYRSNGRPEKMEPRTESMSLSIASSMRHPSSASTLHEDGTVTVPPRVMAKEEV